eukprot:TRINITY_DN24284_c0_g1_i1.p2 TRINITY_DN24284_c0_g1~~TRINITY_DN24284_c0_g1_i1.p2  ORF type:complete len:169 (+),score=24.68 TRINITY_DN24284_c0_g1_i1:118-624(+)
MQKQIENNIKPDKMEKQIFQIEKKRRLVIIVQKAEKLSENVEPFVYFQILEKDYTTPKDKGPNPTWNYKQVFDVNFDDDFQSYLQKSSVNFIVFDDKQPVGDEFSAINDILGECSIKLDLLISNVVIEEKLPFRILRIQSKKRGTSISKSYGERITLTSSRKWIPQRG